MIYNCTQRNRLELFRLELFDCRSARRIIKSTRITINQFKMRGNAVHIGRALLMWCALAWLGGCSGSTEMNVYVGVEDVRKIWIDEVKMLQMNYSIASSSLTGSDLLLAVCVDTEDADVATAYPADNALVSLLQQPSGQLNTSVKGQFVGRTVVQVLFLFSHAKGKVDELRQLCDVGRKSSETRVQSLSGGWFNVTDLIPRGHDSVLSYGMWVDVVVHRQRRAVDVAFNVVVVVLVVVVNLGLGCKVRLAVVKEVLRRPVAPAIGFASQFIIMPLISFGTVKALQFEPAMALGFFALGCSPGGSASNAYTLLLEGDVTLSITMTFVSTVAALGMLPMWLFSLGRFLYSDSDIQVPYQNMFYSLVGLLVPTLIGLLLQHKRPAWAKVMVKVSKGLMVVFIIFVLTVGIYANLYIFYLITWQVALAAAVLPYLGFTLGGAVALLARMPRHRVIAIAVETGIQNTGVAIVLLLLSLPPPESDISIVAPIMASTLTPLPLVTAIAVIHGRRRCCPRGEDEGGGKVKVAGEQELAESFLPVGAENGTNVKSDGESEKLQSST